MNKGKIVIKLNNDRDGLSVNSTWETSEDREMIERVLKMFSDKIEYIKVDISGSECGSEY